MAYYARDGFDSATAVHPSVNYGTSAHIYNNCTRITGNKNTKQNKHNICNKSSAVKL